MAKGNRGGKRANGGLVVSQQDLSKMTDDELNKLDNKFISSIEFMNNELTRLVRGPSKDNPTGAQSKEYYNAVKKLGDLRKSYRKVIDEKTKRASEKAKNTPRPKKTFVNSYGEATTREITSSTYKRAEKRRQKELEKWLGEGLVRRW